MQMKQILSSCYRQRKLTSYDFFRPFEEATDLMQDDSYVTSSCSLLLVRPMQEDLDEGTVKIERADGNVGVSNLSKARSLATHLLGQLSLRPIDSSLVHRSILRSCIARLLLRSCMSNSFRWFVRWSTLPHATCLSGT